MSDVADGTRAADLNEGPAGAPDVQTKEELGRENPRWYGTWVAQAPDRYKKDEAKLDDLLKHKNIGEVLDRMYAAEEQAEQFSRAGSEPGEEPVIPDSPDGYELQAPELPEFMQAPEFESYLKDYGVFAKDAQSEIKELAHELQLSPAAVQRVSDYLHGKFFQAMEAAIEENRKAKEAGDLALKKDWKGQYDPNMEMCRRMISTFDPDGEFSAEIEAEGGLANQPGIMKFVFRVSKVMSEDILVPGSTAPQEPTKQDSKISKLIDRYPSMAKSYLGGE